MWVAIAAGHEGRVCIRDVCNLMRRGSGQGEAARLDDGIQIRLKAGIQLIWVNRVFDF